MRSRRRARGCRLTPPLLRAPWRWFADADLATFSTPSFPHTRRRLFAELQAGPWLSADPTAFARTLALDHSVQQDGGEFMKLLLTLLERLFRESGLEVHSLR